MCCPTDSSSLVIKIRLVFLFICLHTVSTQFSSLLLCLSLSVCQCLTCSDRCPVAGLADFWDGSSWHWLVGHWHGCLDWTLSEKPSVWCPVFAADRGHGGTAEGQGQGPASGCSQCPSCTMTLLEEGGHRERRWAPMGWVVPRRQGL